MPEVSEVQVPKVWDLINDWAEVNHRPLVVGYNYLIYRDGLYGSAGENKILIFLVDRTVSLIIANPSFFSELESILNEIDMMRPPSWPNDMAVKNPER